MSNENLQIVLTNIQSFNNELLERCSTAEPAASQNHESNESNSENDDSNGLHDESNLYSAQTDGYENDSKRLFSLSTQSFSQNYNHSSIFNIEDGDNGHAAAFRSQNHSSGGGVPHSDYHFCNNYTNYVNNNENYFNTLINHGAATAWSSSSGSTRASHDQYEEISTASVVNSNYRSPVIEGNQQPLPQQDGMRCRVCLDKATGVHYGIVTCEGCKVIFFYLFKDSTQG
jgi:hypothetical protein